MDAGVTLVAVPAALAAGGVAFAAQAVAARGAARAATACAALVAVGAAVMHAVRLAAHPASTLTARVGRPLALGRHALSTDLALGGRGAVCALAVAAAWLAASATLPRGRGALAARHALAVGLAAAGAAAAASAGGVTALAWALALGTLGVALSCDDERLERLPLVVASDTALLVVAGFATWSAASIGDESGAAPGPLSSLMDARAELFVRVGVPIAAARLLLAARASKDETASAAHSAADTVSVVHGAGLVMLLACARAAPAASPLGVAAASVALAASAVAVLLAVHAAAQRGAARLHGASLATLALALVAVALGAPSAGAAFACVALLGHVSMSAEGDAGFVRLGALAVAAPVPGLGASLARAEVLDRALSAGGLPKALGALVVAATWLAALLLAYAVWCAPSQPRKVEGPRRAVGVAAGVAALVVGVLPVRELRPTATFLVSLTLTSLAVAAAAWGGVRGARVAGDASLDAVGSRVGASLVAALAFLHVGARGVDAALLGPAARGLFGGARLVGKGVALLARRPLGPPIASRALAAVAARTGVDDRASLERVALWSVAVLALVLAGAIFITIVKL
ncbi:MAG: hypothetical protein R3B36_25710 [Polyangiaceae bacterium]